MLSRLRCLARDEEGALLAEYELLVGLIAVVAMGTVALFGDRVTEQPEFRRDARRAPGRVVTGPAADQASDGGRYGWPTGRAPRDFQRQ